MINEQRLVDEFCRIVQIDSPTNEEAEMAADMVRVLAEMDITATIDEHGNVFARIPGEGQPLLLNAHLDTVEPGRGIEPIVEDGVIRSVGQTILGGDNKVAVAAMLEAIRSLREQGTTHAPIELLFTTSEEVANLGAIGFDTTQLEARYGYTCDSGDDIGTITIASPFYNRFDITLTGRAAHASRPEEAMNVLQAFHNALSQLQLGRISENTVCNIGLLKGGDARNTVPGHMTLNGEVRSFLREELDEVTDRIVSAFQQAGNDMGIQVDVDVVLENDGFFFAEDDDFVSFTNASVQSVVGDTVLKKSSECYDANIFNGRGIQVLNIANQVQGMHTVDERIAVRHLVQTTEIMARLITDFSSFQR